jgi:hypothetical protein
LFTQYAEAAVKASAPAARHKCLSLLLVRSKLMRFYITRLAGMSEDAPAFAT